MNCSVFWFSVEKNVFFRFIRTDSALFILKMCVGGYMRRKCNETQFREMEEFRGAEPQRQLLHGFSTPRHHDFRVFAHEHTHHGPPTGGGGSRRLKMDCNNPKASRDRELRVFPNPVSLLLFAVRFEFPAFNRTLAAVSPPNFRQRAILRIPCEFAGMNCSRSLLRTTEGKKASFL